MRFLLLVLFIIVGYLYIILNAAISSVKGSNELKEINIKPQNKLIIGHIAGSSGVGKTYHAEILAKKYPDIEFKDLDELIDPIKKNKKTFAADTKKAIQTFISSTDKPIVFVGYNDYTIDTHYWIDLPNHKYFLTDKPDVIIDRRLKRYKQIKKSDPSAKEISHWVNEIVNDEKLYKKKLYRMGDYEDLYQDLEYQISMVRKKIELNKLPWKPVIIHVSGPSGVGKTTLANKLKALTEDLDVYDSDDIMDDIVRKLSKDHPGVFKKAVLDNSKQWDKLYQKYIVNRLCEIFDKAAKAKHHVAIIGITVDLTVIADYKFMIDLPLKENYIRRTKREIGTICDNRKQIEKAIEGDPVIADIEIFTNLGHRMKIIEPYGKEIKKTQEVRDIGKILGYKLLPTAEIEEEIKKICG
jgi:adenylate kinase family enzyme